MTPAHGCHLFPSLDPNAVFCEKLTESGSCHELDGRAVTKKGSSSNFGKVDTSRVAPAALLGERSIRPSTDVHRFRGFAPITPSNFPPSLVWAAPTRSFVHSTPPGFDSPYSTGMLFTKVLRMLAGGRRRGATRSTRCESLKSVEIGGRLYRSSRSVKLTKGSPSACLLPKCDDEPK